MTAILDGCIEGVGCKEEMGWLLSTWVFEGGSLDLPIPDGAML